MSLALSGSAGRFSGEMFSRLRSFPWGGYAHGARMAREGRKNFGASSSFLLCRQAGRKTEECKIFNRLNPGYGENRSIHVRRGEENRGFNTIITNGWCKNVLFFVHLEPVKGIDAACRVTVRRIGQNL